MAKAWFSLSWILRYCRSFTILYVNFVLFSCLDMNRHKTSFWPDALEEWQPSFSRTRNLFPSCSSGWWPLCASWTDVWASLSVPKTLRFGKRGNAAIKSCTLKIAAISCRDCLAILLRNLEQILQFALSDLKTQGLLWLRFVGTPSPVYRVCPWIRTKQLYAKMVCPKLGTVFYSRKLGFYCNGSQSL